MSNAHSESGSTRKKSGFKKALLSCFTCNAHSYDDETSYTRSEKHAADSRPVTAQTANTVETEQTGPTGQTWEDFLDGYAHGKITTTEPPMPTGPRPDGLPPFLPPPKPPTERQRMLDTFRYTGLDKAPIHESKDAGDDAGVTDDSDTMFKIVALARQTFGSAVCMISLLDDEKQYFKAEVGFEKVGLVGLDELPRDISFCGHTILRPEPMVILDANKDWRMQNNPLVTDAPHVAFYAGAPIVSPEGHALGTFCVIDTKPREKFGKDERAKLQEFARLAMAEIENLYHDNQTAKAESMQRSLEAFRQAAPQFGLNSSREEIDTILAYERAKLRAKGVDVNEEVVLKSGKNEGVVFPTSSPSTESVSQFENGGSAPASSYRPATQTTDTEYDDSVAPTSLPPPPRSEEPRVPVLAEPLETEHAIGPTSPTPADDSKRKNPYDLATVLIAQSLRVDLVYLLSLELNAAGQPTTRLMSSFGLPSPPPTFDVVLHARALSSKSGLLYQNPEAEDPANKELPETYTSGMLVPVFRKGSQEGCVLAVFTRQKHKYFGADDLKYLRDFGIQLVEYCSSTL
ncbi:hypothetical protein G7K_0740-t1 [Saitoella complicata NRRL Y-17804]|uniref:GAF domain-containing protein n=2 Tax=Saitoella complicata (strain BCRC 22490 / CBS 7301 / JCM 7358 / NBRC 10748 / NRRL Y-17804) TaxID=698492 RepID=A0A0E9NAS5_SAICN|nr:hypothetical protein G7K_0740-t1 [Saitoella complicata NRRL Y-17804]